MYVLDLGAHKSSYKWKGTAKKSAFVSTADILVPFQHTPLLSCGEQRLAPGNFGNHHYRLHTRSIYYAECRFMNTIKAYYVVDLRLLRLLKLETISRAIKTSTHAASGV
jgi:hypothetical protein